MGELAKIESFCELSKTNLSFKRDVSKDEWMDVFKALNKTVIFVLEPGHEKARYFEFLKQFADVVYETLDEGIEYLKTF